MRYEVSQGPPSIRVLIADSTHMGSHLLAEALQRERRFTVIGCAATRDEILAALPAAPEVVILALDFERPRGGLEIPAKIVGQACPAVLLLLDNSCDPGLVVQAFRAGARGVFSRSQSLPEMCKCLECLARGQVWATGEQINYLLQGLQRSVVPPFLNGAGMSLLSRREQEVVRYLCDGLTNRDIARVLGLSEHTVKNHLLRIYAKLGVEKRVEVISSLLSHSLPAEPLDRSTPPSGSEAERLQWYLQLSRRSTPDEYLLERMCSDEPAATRDPLAAYTWLLRSERGATELIGKCRAVRELLGNNLTSEQRRQAETRAARSWRRQLPARSSRARLEPERRLPLAPAGK